MGDKVRRVWDEPPAPANLNEPPGGEPLRRVAVALILNLKREIDRFLARWPAPEARESILPEVTWSQLERQLADLAGCPTKAAMARDLVSATRKMAPYKPPEMVLREILCMAWALLDESFQPDLDPEPDPADTP